MKLFDYKFLILLGLTLVVYFMFREIMDLRNKVSTLENNLEGVNKKFLEYNNKPNKNTKKTIEESTVDEKPTLFQIPLPKLPGEDLIENKSPKKVKTNVKHAPVIELNKTCNLDEKSDEISVEKSEEMVMLQSLNKKLSTIEESAHNSETESEEDSNTNDGEHLAIYSNDNEEDILEDFSLEESSEIKTEDIMLDSDKKKNLLVKSEEDNELEESKTSELSLPSDLNFEDVSTNKYSYSDLMKNKLSELQCIAESLKIELTNNGKKKTKSELSKDIVKLSNTNQESI